VIRKTLSKKLDPELENLNVPDEYRSLLYYIKGTGTHGASTLALKAEHYGNISRMIQRLEAEGAIIHTVRRKCIDKRGNQRSRIAHRIYLGIREDNRENTNDI